MTEPVPGQTPEPAVTDAVTATPPAAEQQPTETPETSERPEARRTDATGETDAMDETGAAATGPDSANSATAGVEPTESTSTESTPAAPGGVAPEAVGPEAAVSEAAQSEAAGAEAGAGAGAVPPNPQELFGSLSLSAIEADIDRLMNDKMSQLDGMLAGLEDLVQRLEGEITNLEPPPDAPTTP
ncbi:hypothetical protein [Saccharothrix sp. NRRL B-16314]|uniref:hypothetical protein n=1 Tax=Saccharothrix sp. NRRL B-16314 TaxID=1463825 RepID=UPI000527ACA1|nr:hypothetical protein [Saccharothrix sp. NRRL B-16314]